MKICKAPTLRLKALTKHSMTHIRKWSVSDEFFVGVFVGPGTDL